VRAAAEKTEALVNEQWNAAYRTTDDLSCTRAVLTWHIKLLAWTQRVAASEHLCPSGPPSSRHDGCICGSFGQDMPASLSFSLTNQLITHAADPMGLLRNTWLCQPPCSFVMLVHQSGRH
jgi:hypothetical protein